MFRVVHFVFVVVVVCVVSVWGMWVWMCAGRCGVCGGACVCGVCVFFMSLLNLAVPFADSLPQYIKLGHAVVPEFIKVNVKLVIQPNPVSVNRRED